MPMQALNKSRSECTIFVHTDTDPLKFTVRLYYTFFSVCLYVLKALFIDLLLVQQRHYYFFFFFSHNQ